MNEQFVVLQPTPGGGVMVYGPLEVKEAEAFAQFMSREVDPGTTIRKLHSPIDEMLGWYQSVHVRKKETPDARR